jgi:hypothetical protein
LEVIVLNQVRKIATPQAIVIPSKDSDSSFTEKELKVENPNENSELIRSNNDSNVDQLKIEETSNNEELVLNACQSKCCCKIC